ncbi:MAG: RidA family protein [Ignavibacteria bacterium]|nr:RidA family protein [Ignavibacteria bacterium]
MKKAFYLSFLLLFLLIIISNNADAQVQSRPSAFQINNPTNQKGTKIMKKSIFTEKAPMPIGPYSQASQAGNTIYVSGQLPIDPATGKIIEGDIKKEAELVLNNIKAILEAAGYEMKDIVKTTIFLTDLANFKIVNEIYGSYFTGNFPARETVQVAALPLNGKIEISVIAVK